MKKIDIIYPGSLASHIGPSQTINRLKAARNIFIQHDIELNIFDRKVKKFKGKKYLKDVIQNKVLGSRRIYAYLYILRTELNRFKFIKNYIIP